MASNTYSLSALVLFLEAALSAMGHAQPSEPTSTRRPLKTRFRKLRRLYERLLRDSDWPVRACVALTTDSGCSTSGAYLQGSFSNSTRVVGLLPSNCDVDEVLVGVGSAALPWRHQGHAFRLDVALRLDREGPESFFESLMSYWALRHKVVTKTASPDKRSRRRRALDRLFMALMRSVFGFFGSHKVDARNNP